jgi:hypothetical protein
MLLLLSLLCSPSFAAPKVSLLTVSPGKDLFEAFGHSALVVEDTKTHGTSNVYEYPGVSTSAVSRGAPMTNLVNLLDGRVRLPLAAAPITEKAFRARYAASGRKVSKDLIKLSPKQAEALVDAIEKDQAEKSYTFNIFRSNCATKLRDPIFAVLDPKLRAAYDPAADLTFKDIIEGGIDEAAAANGSVSLPLGAFVKGAEAEKQVATIMQSMDIPVELKSGKDFETTLTKLDPLVGLSPPLAKRYRAFTQGELTRSITWYEAVMTPKRLREAIEWLNKHNK